MRYFIRKPCCVHLCHFKTHPKAQRNHVTCICSTILLTFSLVKASGDRPRGYCWIGLGRCVLSVSKCQGETVSPSPVLTARCCVLTAPALPCVLHTACTWPRLFWWEKKKKKRREKNLADPAFYLIITHALRNAQSCRSTMCYDMHGMEMIVLS